MGLFGKKAKRGPSLEDMIAASERYRGLIMSTFLKDRKVDECPVYKGDHWEIEYFILIPEALEKLLEKEKASFTFNIADTYFSHSMPGDEYTPLPLLFFQIHEEEQYTFVMYANSRANVGKPGLQFEALDYLWILCQQPEITLTLKGQRKNYVMTIPNPAKSSSLLYDMRNTMNAWLSSPGEWSRYSSYTLQYMGIDQHRAEEEGISVGQFCLRNYRMMNLDL